MSSEMPDPWRSRAEELGLAPTYRGFADKSGLGVETVRQAILGTNGRRPSPATIRALAELLQVGNAQIDAWCGYRKSQVTADPYRAPEAASRLTPRQRKAVDAIILAMVEPNERRRSTAGDPKPAAGAELPENVYGLAAHRGRSTGKSARRAQENPEGTTGE